LRPVRPKRTAVVVMCFGDASGTGFGENEAWNVDGFEKVHYSYGTWTKDVSDLSSNEREMLNFVAKLEGDIESGKYPPGTELFLFTDNMVFEGCFFHGTSPSRALHEMIVRLRKLEMSGKVFLRVIWVAGRRMIDQGGDGLSRGDLTEGVMGGAHMLQFVPLKNTALQTSATLLPWIKTWSPADAVWLEPADWFERAHEGHGTFFWFPPPCIAEAAVKQLVQARHARSSCWHVFVCPCVMTYRWRKVLRRAADVLLTIKPGPTFWPKGAYEPLTIAICCPYLNSPPHYMRERPVVSCLYRDLSGVWEGSEAKRGDRMRQFWLEARALVRLQGRVAP
jgi:hypothetical protein